MSGIKNARTTNVFSGYDYRGKMRTIGKAAVRSLPVVLPVAAGVAGYNLIPEIKGLADSLRPVMNEYQSLFEITTSGLTGIFCDTVAQKAGGAKYSLKRSLSMGALTAVSGGVFYRHFNDLNCWMFPDADTLSIAAKITTEQTLYAFPFLMYMFTGTALIKGEAKQMSFMPLVKSALSAVPKNWMVWVPADIAIYNSGPDMAVNIVNITSLIWLTLLSNMVNKDTTKPQ